MAKNIFGIYLAAGKSSRFGSNKLNERVGDTYLGNIALQTILRSSLTRVIVVTNPTNPLDWLPEEMHKHREKLIPTTCSTAFEGQATSLKHGLKVAKLHGAEAVIIVLADQPFISVTMINKLMQSYQTNQKLAFIASTYNGIPRPPVLFTQAMFDELLKLKGDTGARAIIRDTKHTGSLIAYSHSLPFFDVDMREDLSQLHKKHEQK